MSARKLRLSRVTVKPVRSGLVERCGGGARRLSLGVCVSESTRQVERLVESVLSEAFDG